jgi:hypothetical protein
MLKVYKIIDSVSVDGANWRTVGGYGYKIIDESEKDTTTFSLENMSFDQAYEYLLHNDLCGVWTDKTLFLHRPVIEVRYNDAWDLVPYNKFKQMSYKRELKEWNYVTLEWIMRNASAEQCIQYLKERGMTACPILK